MGTVRKLVMLSVTSALLILTFAPLFKCEFCLEQSSNLEQLENDGVGLSCGKFGVLERR